VPDRSKDAQDERNKRTQLTVRGPDGFPARVKAEAEARGMSVSAFVVTVLERELPQEDTPPGASDRRPAVIVTHLAGNEEQR
jgi:hypothetical protein